MAVKPKTPVPTGSRIVLAKLNRQKMAITLVGTSPLIVHRWSEKALTQIRDKQQGKAKGARAAKNPDEDFWSTLYHIAPGQTFPHKKGYRYGFPAVGIKAAAVTACTSVEGITKVAARQAFHVVGDLVEIKGVPRMREDAVRVGMGAADLRYRAEFPEWSAEVVVEFDGNVLSADQLVNLLDIAGFAVGIGEWRPERNGQFGRFRVGGGK